MKHDVAYRRLSDVVTAKAGNNKIIKGTQSDRPGGGLVQGFSASGPDVWVSSADYNLPGVVLSAVGARCGKTFLAEGAWTAIANTHVLLPSPAVDHRWLWYLTNDESFWVRGGSAQPFVKVKDTLQKEVIVPPLVEQRRIVAILDEAFEGIATAKANAEKNLQNAREVFSLQRDAAFAEGAQSWPTKPLGDVAEVQSGGTPLVSRNDFWGGEIAWYSSGELNEIETSEPERFITKAGLDGSNAKLFPKGSLLVGMYDTAALKMSMLDRTATFNQAIAGVKPNPRLDMEFLFHAINFQKPALLSLRRGVRQKNLSLGKIKEIVVPVPSAQVQRNIVDRLRLAQELSDRLRAVYQRKLDAHDELKKSLLHQAFTGAL